MEWDIIEIIAITVDIVKIKIKAVNGIENIELIRCLGHTLSMKILIFSYWFDIDVIDFWRQYELKFPLLSQEAKIIFCVQGASTASELDFSASGYTVLDRRNVLANKMWLYLPKNALLPRKVNKMIVLQQFETNILIKQIK